jgi:hypothetical protein
MNRYYFENGRFVFEGTSGDITTEKLFEERRERIYQRLREELIRGSIELYPYRKTNNGEVVFMTLNEGCRDTKFSRVS